MNAFSPLLINEKLSESLSLRGITVPTEVQKQVIPAVFAGRNTIFQSETGTGKTFAYLLPLITKLAEKPERTVGVRIIILAPTHELSSQIKRETELLAREITPPLKSALFIGGAPIKRQLEKLKEKPEIICGAPARILELIHMKKIKTDAIQSLVLDEADRLMSPEMRDITVELISALGRNVQLVACSATIHRNIIRILENTGQVKAGEEEKKREFAEFFLPPEDVLKRKITHWAFYAEQRDKIACLRSFLRAEKPLKALVFSSRTGQIANIAEQLIFNKVQCCSMYSETDKIERKKAIDDFRSGRCNILITTDLAARGLDIENITHIIQLDLPEDAEFFIHRAGRTARAGKEGYNILIGDEKELRRLASFEKKLDIIVYPKVFAYGKVASPEAPSDTEE